MPNENENEKKQPAQEKVDEKKTPEKDKVDEFIEQAKKRNEESVSKAEYEKVKAERDKVMQYVIDGKGDLDQEGSKKEENIDITALKKKLANPDISNLEYIETSLKLRQAAIDKGESDPYLPKSGTVTESDIEQAKKIAKVFEETVKEANGNDAVFRALLESKIGNDDPAITAMIRKRSQNKRK